VIQQKKSLFVFQKIYHEIHPKVIMGGAVYFVKLFSFYRDGAKSKPFYRVLLQPIALLVCHAHPYCHNGSERDKKQPVFFTRSVGVNVCPAYGILQKTMTDTEEHVTKAHHRRLSPCFLWSSYPL